MTLEERYINAVNRIGGAFALLDLPEDVRKVLQVVTDFETKVAMLELVAKAMNK